MVGAQRKCAVQVERSVSAPVWPQRRRRRRTRPTVCSAAQPAPRCLGTVSVEPLPASPSWRVRCGCLRDISQNIFCGTAFHPHDQIGVRGHRVVQSVEDRRQHHHVHVDRLGQRWVGTDRSAARIRSHHHRTESPPGPRPPGTRRRAAPYRWRPGARRRGGGHASVQSHDGELVRHGIVNLSQPNWPM